jgi:hypothetical protein
MDNKYNIAEVLVTIIVLIQILFCGGCTHMTKFDWLPTESAHENYPIEIIKGDLVFENGSSIYIPDGKIVHNGWGEFNSTHIAGEMFKPIPVKLVITWFSFVEDKFYGGSFPMPYDKLLKLFSAGMVGPKFGKKITYDQITVGLAPEGEISVWVEAEGVILEVATFKAEEAVIDWKKVLDNPDISRQEYISRVLGRTLKEDQLAELKANGVPKNISEKYRKQYSWSVDFIGGKPLDMWMKTYNGECEYYDFNKIESTRTDHSVPKTIKLNWQNTSGEKLTVKIKFDEVEMFKAYRKFFKDTENNKVQLHVEITEFAINIFMTDSKYLLRLEKCTAGLYNMQ